VELDAENLAENWADNYEQKIDYENLICTAYDCSDSITNWDDSSIPDCKFWSMNCYSV